MQLHNATRAKLQLGFICERVFRELPPRLHSITRKDFFTVMILATETTSLSVWFCVCADELMCLEG